MNYRKGSFTSSSIHKLLAKGRKAGEMGKPALTYIAEKNIETRLGRSLSQDVYSQAIAWGDLMEKVVFELMPDEYKLVYATHVCHPNDEFKHIWKGAADMVVEGKLISEIKSYQLKNFAQYADCLMKQDVELFKSLYPQEYWQIISNCILNEVDEGEAVLFMPYKEHLELIRAELDNGVLLDKYNLEPWKYRFIVEKPINDLAWIEKGGHYKNITIFRFEAPDDDIWQLTEAVRKGSELLIK